MSSETLASTFVVQSYRGPYRVEQGVDTVEALDARLGSDDVILADAHLLKLYPALSKAIEQRPHLLIEPSEQAKSFGSLIPLIRELTARHFSKAGRLVALGGGVIQDITAFVASIYQRGARWVFIPTTLLAQCDSCIGSKTSINFEGFKNQLGGFYPPQEIWIDPSFLRTLPPIEIKSGLGEMFHYFLVSGEEDFTWANGIARQALTDQDLLNRLIVRSLQIKKAMIEIDEFDTGPRNVFNYGHSFGHALESAIDYAVPHGVCVGVGMNLANLVSVDLGLIPADLQKRIAKALRVTWEGVDFPEIDVDRFIAALRKDKKNVGSQVHVILTRGLGDMYKTELAMSDTVVTRIAHYLRRQQWREPEQIDDGPL